jgi:hypothetical protein
MAEGPHLTGEGPETGHRSNIVGAVAGRGGPKVPLRRTLGPCPRRRRCIRLVHVRHVWFLSRPAAGRHPGSRALWRRWVLLVSAGELAGFCMPGVLGALTAETSSGTQLPILVVGGIVEGAALGGAQALVLRRVLPGFRSTAWVVATSVAAGFAWLLGMLPSATQATWSTWPTAWVVVAATLLGAVLLLSIGTAQTWVMPAGIPSAHVWIWWTALGWCAGLATFTVVAPPLWHEGQSAAVIALIGAAGGVAMAVAMAAVTGVGIVRLCARAAGLHSGNRLEGSRVLSSIVGTPVCSKDGKDEGRVRDLLIDLAGGLARVPVTGVLVGGGGRTDRVVAWERLHDRGSYWVLDPTAPGDVVETGSTEVLIRRDILDSPVVLADPPGRARVSDVVLDLADGRAWLTGLDISTAGALRRMLGRPVVPERTEQVSLAKVHLVSAPAHSAQLAVPDAMVYRLEPPAMAEVLTRVPVPHARDILRVADPDVLDSALPLLHPHVLDRLTGAGPAPRRTRRLAGWRMHRPYRRADQAPVPGQVHPKSSGPQAER